MINDLCTDEKHVLYKNKCFKRMEAPGQAAAHNDEYSSADNAQFGRQRTVPQTTQLSHEVTHRPI